METMIVDLKSIYSTGPLLNVVYCGWMYALALHQSAPLNRENHSQIIHCTHDIWLWCCHVSILFIYSKKKKLRMGWHHYTRNTSIWFLFLLICHQSCMQVARGYNVPLNSHYEFRYKLHHMRKQMKLPLKLTDRIMQKHDKNNLLQLNRFLLHDMLMWISTCSRSSSSCVGVDGREKISLKMQEKKNPISLSLLLQQL